MKIVLIGPPGSGKGTISFALVKDASIVHISTGNLFRKTAKSTGSLSEQLRMIMGSGQLVPDDLTNEIAKNEIIDTTSKNLSFVLDGYPRTVEQASFLDTVCDIDKVFYLDVNHDILVKRIIGRRTCPKCGRIYNIYFHPPKNNEICDDDQTILSQRKDDNFETVENRMQVYQTQTTPLVEFYEKQNKLVRVDGAMPIDKVIEIIKKETHYDIH